MAGGFSITISAVDRASAQFEKVNKAMKRLTAPVKQFQASFQRFASASGLSKVASSMGELGRNAFGAFQSLTRIVEPLAAITGAASVAGLYRLVSAWGQFGTQLRNQSQRIGISADRLQALQGAAQLAGSSAGGLTSGLAHLKDAMTDALGGRNSEMLLYARQFGVNIGDIAHGAADSQTALKQWANVISRIKDPTIQARVATVAFGGAAEDLLPLLRSGSKGIDDYLNQSKQYGVMNEAGTKAAFELSQAQTKVELAVIGVGNAIAQTLAPVLTPLLTQLANWISSNRTLVSSAVLSFVQRFTTWLKTVDWDRVGKGIHDFGSGVQHVVDLFGGWQRAAELTLGFMAGRWLIGMLAPIAKVSAALARVMLLTLAAGGGGAASVAKGLLARGVGGLALEAALPIALGAAAAYGLGAGGVSIGKNDTMILPAAPKNVEEMVRAEAKRQGVDPDRMVALMRRESHGDQSLVSSAGAIGLMQLMPETAASLGVDPNDPAQNIRGGISYYKQALTKFRGNHDAAEAAYNAGPNRESVAYYAATGDGSRLPVETQRYVSSIDATTANIKNVARGGAGSQDAGPQRVVVELHHANPPPPGFRVTAKPAPKVSVVMGATPVDYTKGY